MVCIYIARLGLAVEKSLSEFLLLTGNDHVVWGPAVGMLTFIGFSGSRCLTACAWLEIASKPGGSIKLSGELWQLLQSTDSNTGF